MSKQESIHNSYQSRRLISLKEARKLLGQNYSTLQDVEVELILNDLEFMAELTLRHIGAVPSSTMGSFKMPRIGDN